MGYPDTSMFPGLIEKFSLYAQLQHEYGAENTEAVVRQTETALRKAIDKLARLPVNKELAAKEPDDLPTIRKFRPKGPRRIWKEFDEKVYRDRLEGALLARFAGCTLGAPVEAWPVEKMENFAKELGKPFPPQHYWDRVTDPYELRYFRYERRIFARPNIDGVPADDDLAYTLLGLLTVEEYGHDFTIEENGKSWVKHLPLACTAEEIALNSLKKGVAAKKAAEQDNPYIQWIGADIRSDPWGYLAAGNPEYAADMAYRDAALSHRRNGIYGEMFFSAAIAAAFTVDHPLEAIEIGLTEIPRDCSLTKAVKWALKTAPKIKDYKQGRAAVDEELKGMHIIHTINNACLTVFGLALGDRDVTKVIANTVAMGMDNDCTGATAGSIVGAVVGKKGVPAYWTKPFKGVLHTYVNGHPDTRITELVDRYAVQAKKVAASFS